MINKVSNCYSPFTLTIACFVDRYAEAITRLPSVFQIWILLDGANDSFAPDAHPGGFAVPPKELPTIRSLLPLDILADSGLAWSLLRRLLHRRRVYVRALGQMERSAGLSAYA